ncbi:MAG: tetratricopeptide repeat protein, partial [Parasporobacterium sp.]|nr:tetratricopeptide repeat protein [Parasporobacterium sp.]
MEPKNRFTAYFKNRKRLLAIILCIVLVFNIAAAAITTVVVINNNKAAESAEAGAASDTSAESLEASQPAEDIDPVLQEKLNAFYNAYSAGDYNKALEHITYVIDNYKVTAAEYCQRGLVYSRLGQNDKAIPDLQAALKLDPEDFTSLSLLAQIYTAEEKYQEASDALGKAISLIESKKASTS